MNKFEQERIHNVSLNVKTFKHPIPVVYADPKSVNDQTRVLIYVGGLGSTNSFNLYMNSCVYDNNYFVTYDKIGHGDNKNKPSQFKSKFLKELDAVVDWATKQFGKKIYLLGESWGCAINFLYLKKHREKIAGVLNWNMPTKPVDPEKKTFKQMYSVAWRHIVTFLFNINFKLPPVQTSHAPLSRNQLLLRARAMMGVDNSSTRLTLAVWRYMKPSYRFLKKNASNPLYKFLYIQSGQDALATWKHIEKIEKQADSFHYYKMPTGYHILSMEPEESKDLYNKILEFIK